MVNENCLMGMRCPKCGYNEMFAIEITSSWATVTDDGAEIEGAIEWGEDCGCRCGACDYEATVKDFTRVDAPRSEGGPGEYRKPAGAWGCPDCGHHSFAVEARGCRDTVTMRSPADFDRFDVIGDNAWCTRCGNEHDIRYFTGEWDMEYEDDDEDTATTEGV